MCSTSGNIVELGLKPGVKYVFTTLPLPVNSSAATPSAVDDNQAGGGQKMGFTCNVCNFSTRDNYNLDKHWKSMHTLKDPAMVCKRYCFELWLFIITNQLLLLLWFRFTFYHLWTGPGAESTSPPTLIGNSTPEPACGTALSARVHPSSSTETSTGTLHGILLSGPSFLRPSHSHGHCHSRALKLISVLLNTYVANFVVPVTTANLSVIVHSCPEMLIVTSNCVWSSARRFGYPISLHMNMPSIEN